MKGVGVTPGGLSVCHLHNMDPGETGKFEKHRHINKKFYFYKRTETENTDVLIAGCKLPDTRVDVGVPQDSVLVPRMYCI